MILKEIDCCPPSMFTSSCFHKSTYDVIPPHCLSLVPISSVCIVWRSADYLEHDEEKRRKGAAEAR